jgi:hypothetical protein
VSRDLTSAALQAIFAQQTGEVLLFLVTIDHATFGAPVRLVSDKGDVVSGGETYSTFPFSVVLPTEDPEQIPRCSIQICNVDRQILAALEELSTPPTVEVSIVLASTPNTVEVGPFRFLLVDYSEDALQIQGTLSHRNVLDEPFPARSFTPAEFRGLFG